METESYKQQADGSVRIEQTIHVETVGQKKIIVGIIKDVGIHSRAEMKKFLGCNVHLFLQVCVCVCMCVCYIYVYLFMCVCDCASMRCVTVCVSCVTVCACVWVARAAFIFVRTCEDTLAASSPHSQCPLHTICVAL